MKPKTIQLTLGIGKHDLERKLAQAVKFLESGSPVRVQVILRGRQRAHPERAVKFLEEISKDYLKDFKSSGALSASNLVLFYNPPKKSGSHSASC